jgi:uncharacterized protein YdcH (DUF465 family)
MTNVAAARDQLEKKDANYRRLARKHEEYEKRLEELQALRYLSDEEKFEEVRIKKLKLAVKDEMESIVRRASV